MKWGIGSKEREALLKVLRSVRMEKHRIESAKYMEISTMLNYQPLKLIAIWGYMIKFSQIKNVSDTEIL